jgi:hypothetical protein
LGIVASLSPDDPDYDKKTKLIACVNLVKANLIQDKDYLPEIAKLLKVDNSEKLTEEFMSNTILNCYSRISFIKSADLINKKDSINPFTKENKDLLDLMKLTQKYDTEEKFVKDLVKLKALMEISKDELVDLKTLVSNKANKLIPPKKPEREPEEEVNHRYEGGNLHLSLFTKLSSSVKYGVAIVVACVFILFFYWGLSSLTKKEEKKKVKKN